MKAKLYYEIGDYETGDYYYIKQKGKIIKQGKTLRAVTNNVDGTYWELGQVRKRYVEVILKNV